MIRGILSFMLGIALALGIGILATSAVADADDGAALTIRTGDLVRQGLPRPHPVPEWATWWLYPISITETSGKTGVRFDRYKKCYEGGESFKIVCTPERSDIVRLYGTDYIKPGGTLTLKKPAWVWSKPTGKTIRVFATYYGTDDRGRPVEAGYEFTFVAE